jgi:hypothetical protein
MKFPCIIVLAFISSWLYRRGGSSSGNTKIRDLSIPLVTLTYLWFLGSSSKFTPFPLKIGLFLGAFLLMFGSLTTYWDWLFKDKDNLYFHGIGVGLAAFPLIWCGIPWYGIIGRTILLSLSFGLINKYVNKWLIPHSDEVEEYSRGGLIILSLPILLL